MENEEEFEGEFWNFENSGLLNVNICPIDFYGE